MDFNKFSVTFSFLSVLSVMSVDKVFNSLDNNLDFIRFYRMMVLPLSRSDLFCALSKKVIASRKVLVLSFNPV